MRRDPETLHTFEQGALWQRLCERTEHALACGALHPIRAALHWIEDGGVRFLVRMLSSVARKDLALAERAARHTRGDFNPFLPYETDLFVADLSATHVALLNKFNVVPHHLLIITQRFQHQETVLSKADFEALWACMREYASLGFYNSGGVAGASQRHKHLQVVPLPLAPEGPDLPLGPLIAQVEFADGIGTCPALPYAHAMARLDEESWLASPIPGPAAALSAYERLLATLGLRPGESGHLPPYNLLVTKAWMLVIPRSREAFDGISVNALGFAGAMIARDEAQLERIRQAGPLATLLHVAYPRQRP